MKKKTSSSRPLTSAEAVGAGDFGFGGRPTRKTVCMGEAAGAGDFGLGGRSPTSRQTTMAAGGGGAAGRAHNNRTRHTIAGGSTSASRQAARNREVASKVEGEGTVNDRIMADLFSRNSEELLDDDNDDGGSDLSSHSAPAENNDHSDTEGTPTSHVPGFFRRMRRTLLPTTKGRGRPGRATVA